MLRIALRIVAALAALAAAVAGYDTFQTMSVRPLTPDVAERLTYVAPIFVVTLAFAIGCAAMAQVLQLLHAILARLPRRPNGS